MCKIYEPVQVRLVLWLKTPGQLRVLKKLWRLLDKHTHQATFSDKICTVPGWPVGFLFIAEPEAWNFDFRTWIVIIELQLIYINILLHSKQCSANQALVSAANVTDIAIVRYTLRAPPPTTCTEIYPNKRGGGYFCQTPYSALIEFSNPLAHQLSIFYYRDVARTN